MERSPVLRGIYTIHLCVQALWSSIRTIIITIAALAIAVVGLLGLLIIFLIKTHNPIRESTAEFPFLDPFGDETEGPQEEEAPQEEFDPAQAEEDHLTFSFLNDTHHIDNPPPYSASPVVTPAHPTSSIPQACLPHYPSRPLLHSAALILSFPEQLTDPHLVASCNAILGTVSLTSKRQYIAAAKRREHREYFLVQALQHIRFSGYY